MADEISTVEGSNGLKAYLSPLGAWAFAIGTSIGWGSFVITSNTYLAKSGPLGTALGMLVGFGLMLIIARNYHYMVNRHPECGGAYSFAKHVFGGDQGFLVAWFLGITYLAMFWANATSLPLFARYFIGDLFKFGYLYQLFGYDVYLGEALLTIAAILVVGFLCSRSRRGVSRLMAAMALVFTAAILGCFCAAMLNHDQALFSFDPAFAPDSSAIMQVVGIACISPWAFIGFENISHSSEEFSFSHKFTFKIMVIALVSTTALYVCVALLSISAYPERYTSWFAYMGDLGNLEGLEALPPFYAAHHYLGSAGVFVLIVALFCLVATSLVGNLVALSRLVYALAKDDILPAQFNHLNGNAIPHKAIGLIVGVSVLVPLLGRTTVGWIVDVTTIGAMIIYAFVSASTFKAAREDGQRRDANMGLAGLVLMLLVGVIFLVPSLFDRGSMAPESYFLFTVWAILGFVVFRKILIRDTARRYGRSTVVWAGLLSLVLFMSLSWMGQASRTSIDETLDEIRSYYSGQANPRYQTLDDQTYIKLAADELHDSHSATDITVFGLLAFSLVMMMSNYSIIASRERERERELLTARLAASTDSLTGVKNKHAYAEREKLLNAQIDDGIDLDYSIVVCDVNGLKVVNDTQGHKAGDEYIRSASILICEIFKHSPVFRIGGDEFVAILEGQDYLNRERLVMDLDRRSVENAANGRVVIAVGASDYQHNGERVSEVFQRADDLMYARKKELKSGA